jgi:hypothetical protein
LLLELTPFVNDFFFEYNLITIENSASLRTVNYKGTYHSIATNEVLAFAKWQKLNANGHSI